MINALVIIWKQTNTQQDYLEVQIEDIRITKIF